MAITYSEFARGVRVETAFNVLAVAKRLKAEGKEIGRASCRERV